VKDDEIKNRWREYFDKLFNDESEKAAIELDDLIDTNRRFVRRIQKFEVKKIKKKMKTCKSLERDKNSKPTPIPCIFCVPNTSTKSSESK
jgi:hypothetical protein